MRKGDGLDLHAGKGHPGLLGADIVATYVPSMLYFQRFVRVSLP